MPILKSIIQKNIQKNGFYIRQWAVRCPFRRIFTIQWGLVVCFVTMLVALAPPADAETATHYWGVRFGDTKGPWGLSDSLGSVQLAEPILHSLAQGEQGTGVLLSPAFTAPAETLSLGLRGWSGPNGERGACRAELISAETNEVLYQAPVPLVTERPEEVVWDTRGVAGQDVRLRLTDADSADAFAWVGLDYIDAGDAWSWDAASSEGLNAWTLEGAVPADESRLAWLDGLPYVTGQPWRATEDGAKRVQLNGSRVRRLYLFGMYHTADIGTLLWHYPSDHSMRFFVGDKLGDIVVTYSNGNQDTYPLVLGDTLFWSGKYHEYPEPFASDVLKQSLLGSALRLYPSTPVAGGFRVGFIEFEDAAIEHLAFRKVADKRSSPVIEAMTIETVSQEPPCKGAAPLEPKPLSEPLGAFLDTGAMTLDEDERAKRLDRVRNLLYTTEDNLPDSLPVEMPMGYQGPVVRFAGDLYADILTNAVHHNLADMGTKAEPWGLYRESSKVAASYGGYVGFGTYKVAPSPYRDHCWSRGVGRALQEFLAFGYEQDTAACMAWCFEQARLWEAPENDHLRVNGVRIPAHWSRNLAHLAVGQHTGVFENDGHGMLMLVAWNVWRRLPAGTRDDWTRRWWGDIQDAAEWIIWQFENPEVFGTGEVLMTDSECNFMIGVGVADGTSIYADYPCMEGLLRFAEMAESIGENEDAAQWREWAARMREGIENHYIQGDGTTHPRAWTLWGSGWAYQSALLAPLIFLPDTRGMLPEDDRPEWRAINEASFQRLVDKWAGKGDPDEEWWYLPHEMPLYNAPNRQFPVQGNYSVAMGYGQAFVTQAALLLDRMEDAEPMVEWTAKAIYNANRKPYIVPEGVEVSPDGAAWFRTGDQGNGFQQAATMKTLRLLIGVDDTQATTLRLVPRVPRSWDRVSVADFPAWLDAGDGVRRYALQYEMQRNPKGMTLDFNSDHHLPKVLVRLGPLQGTVRNVRCDGEDIDHVVKTSGDSDWVRVELPTGRTNGRIEVVYAP